MLAEIDGSYLFNIDQTNGGVPVRIIQDPESLRALSERDGSAWEAWSTLNKDLLIQMNSSDHNPAVTPGYSPTSSPELNTPWFMQYYVKGGPDDSACVGGGVGPAAPSGCQHGYVMSNANWDPYPIDNEVEALTNALANVAVNDDLVPQRFENTFFTVISPDDSSLSSAQLTNSAGGADDYTLASLMAEIQTLQKPRAGAGQRDRLDGRRPPGGELDQGRQGATDGGRAHLSAGRGPADRRPVDEYPPDQGRRSASIAPSERPRPRPGSVSDRRAVAVDRSPGRARGHAGLRLPAGQSGDAVLSAGGDPAERDGDAAGLDRSASPGRSGQRGRGRSATTAPRTPARSDRWRSRGWPRHASRPPSSADARTRVVAPDVRPESPHGRSGAATRPWTSSVSSRSSI